MGIAIVQLQNNVRYTPRAGVKGVWWWWWGGGGKYNTPQSSGIVGTILNPSRKNMDLDRTPKKNEMFEGHRLKIKNDC